MAMRFLGSAALRTRMISDTILYMEEKRERKKKTLPGPGRYIRSDGELAEVLFLAKDMPTGKRRVVYVMESAPEEKLIFPAEKWFEYYSPVAEYAPAEPPADAREVYNEESPVMAVGSPAEALKKYFGYDEFRDGQEVLINSILAGRDTLGVMPTGAGKSVCYQIPALMLPGTAIVVSPLISLMKDQVAFLKQTGVKAAFINSSLTARQMDKAVANARSSEYKIIYVAPERLTTQSFVNMCSEIGISLLAVDEAHCISQWGPDFRPSYLGIPDFIGRLGKRPRLCAFTATATERVRQDITNMLGLKNPFVCVTSFDRPNLRFRVRHVTRKFPELLRLLNEQGNSSGIVYCATRKEVESVCAKLLGEGVDAVRYHAGLSDEERAANQEAFSKDDARVMVATNAFGMGIDKSNVRFVIHYSMPGDIESYYQEAGRAGRDGDPADCALIYSKQDIFTQKFFIDKMGEEGSLAPDEVRELKAKARKRLDAMIDYAEERQCLRASILNYFGEAAAGRCGNCSFCLGESSETADEKAKKPARGKGSAETLPRDEGLYEYLKKIRKVVADRRGIPSFVIFTDAALADMSAKKPRTLEEFSKVNGVGVVKEREYGKMFLEAIERYLGDEKG